jgi:hypothetical protein
MFHRNSRRIQRRVRAFDCTIPRFRVINKITGVGFESVNQARFISCRLFKSRKFEQYLLTL